MSAALAPSPGDELSREDAKARRLEIMQHALGLDEFGQGHSYRNHFVTASGCDYECCLTLVSDGLMYQGRSSELTGGDPVFVVTIAGFEFVRTHSPERPKLSRSQRRYQQYLNSDTCLTFGEYLRVFAASRGSL